MQKMILTAAIFAMLFGKPVAAGPLNGELRTTYYTWEEPGGASRFLMTQFAGLNWQAAGSPWSAAAATEMRDGNSPLPGRGDSRLIALNLRHHRGVVDARLGRFAAVRAGDAGSLTDGAEVRLDLQGYNMSLITLSGGREIYPLYRSETSQIPERYRGTVAFEGLMFGRLNYLLDQTMRYRDGENDDAVTRLTLRCQRYRVGWDLRAALDNNQSDLRSVSGGIRLIPHKGALVRVRYSERRIRLYESTPLKEIAYQPTRVAEATLGHDLPWADLAVQVGYARRLREAGDVDRAMLAIVHPMCEAGARWQAGSDLNQIGGWVGAGGVLVPGRLRWGLDLDFDRFDSAWDAEPSDNWANSLRLDWVVWPDAVVSGGVEHYRDREAASDIRGQLAFRVRFGL
ncbi:MAG: hypothetical protein FJY67_03220 [Calditrichaeota bacterium]|nr:hypothetical protein [Calditrichota bacterium]